MRSKQSIIFLECVHLPYPYFCYFPWFSRSKDELLFHFHKISTFIETIYSSTGQRERLQISRDPYYLTIILPTVPRKLKVLLPLPSLASMHTVSCPGGCTGLHCSGQPHPIFLYVSIVIELSSNFRERFHSEG